MHGKMIKAAVRNPILQSRDISDTLRKLHREWDKCFEAFRGKLKSTLLTVKALILSPQTISFDDSNFYVRDRQERN